MKSTIQILSQESIKVSERQLIINLLKYIFHNIKKKIKKESNNYPSVVYQKIRIKVFHLLNWRYQKRNHTTHHLKKLLISKKCKIGIINTIVSRKSWISMDLLTLTLNKIKWISVILSEEVKRRVLKRNKWSIKIKKCLISLQ